MFLSAKSDISLLQSSKVPGGIWFYKHLVPTGLITERPKKLRYCENFKESFS